MKHPHTADGARFWNFLDELIFPSTFFKKADFRIFVFPQNILNRKESLKQARKPFFETISLDTTLTPFDVTQLFQFSIYSVL